MIAEPQPWSTSRREKGEEEPAADALVLPVGRDIEGKDLAGEFRLAAAAAAAAETEDMLVLIDRDAHIVRFALDDGGPAELAPLRRQPDQKRRRQNAGIGRAPSLDIEPRDAARVARPSAADRYLVHPVALCPVLHALGRAFLSVGVNLRARGFARGIRGPCQLWRSEEHT